MMKRGCGRLKSTVPTTLSSYNPSEVQPVVVTNVKKGARTQDGAISEDNYGSEEKVQTGSETLIVMNLGLKSSMRSKVNGSYALMFSATITTWQRG